MQVEISMFCIPHVGAGVKDGSYAFITKKDNKEKLLALAKKITLERLAVECPRQEIEKLDFDYHQLRDGSYRCIVDWEMTDDKEFVFKEHFNRGCWKFWLTRDDRGEYKRRVVNR